MSDPKQQGQHKGCGGHVCDASCQGCGADFIAAKQISQKPVSTRWMRPAKPAKAVKAAKAKRK